QRHAGEVRCRHADHHRSSHTGKQSRRPSVPVPNLKLNRLGTPGSEWTRAMNKLVGREAELRTLLSAVSDPPAAIFVEGDAPSSTTSPTSSASTTPRPAPTSS